MVATTVVSTGAGGGFVIDAGAKILAQDVAPFIAGHGAVVGYPDAVIQRLNDHHGVVDLPAGAARPRSARSSGSCRTTSVRWSTSSTRSSWPGRARRRHVGRGRARPERLTATR
jgi:hypothetical protein